MSVDTSRTITRFLCWSSTGELQFGPMPAQHCILRWRAAPKPSVGTTHSNAIARSSTHNQKILAP